MNQPNDILHEAKKLRLIAAALELQHYTSTAVNVVPIPGGERVIAIGTADQVREVLAAPVAGQQAAPADTQPTDISKRLRQSACFSTEAFNKLLTDAADEIERYYGGMLAWKRTAEKKDRDWQAERMGRVDDRCAARAAASQAALEVGAAPVEVADERALFEAVHCGGNKKIARRNEHGDYVLPSIQDAWSGFQTRAEIAKKATPPAPAQQAAGAAPGCAGCEDKPTYPNDPCVLCGASTTAATASEDARDALAKVRADVRELQNNLETFGQYSQESARAALDGALDVIDEHIAVMRATQQEGGK